MTYSVEVKCTSHKLGVIQLTMAREDKLILLLSEEYDWDNKKR